MQTIPGPYVGYGWQLIGGHLALDLVNTVAWRPDADRTEDRIGDAAHLADWAAVAAGRHGLVVKLSPIELAETADVRLLSQVRGLREATAEAVEAQVTRRPIPSAAMHLIRTAGERARARSEVEPQLPFHHEIRVRSADDLVDALALAVTSLFESSDVARLGRCGDQHCGWFFLDTSRNHSRQWCDPGDCGNRARVRRFSARHRAALGTSESIGR